MRIGVVYLEALIPMGGQSRDAHEQDAFSSRVAHRRLAAGSQVIMSIVRTRSSVWMRRKVCLW